MSTVDEILTSGRYTDRRGRLWEPSNMLNEWFGGIPGDPLDRAWWCSPKEMRLLIERDQHRDECPGLWKCHDHPVPMVYAMPGQPQGGFAAMPRDNYIGQWRKTQAEAMNAARELAVTS